MCTTDLQHLCCKTLMNLKKKNCNKVTNGAYLCDSLNPLGSSLCVLCVLLWSNKVTSDTTVKVISGTKCRVYIIYIL